MAEDWLVDVRKYVPDADEGVVGAIVRYCGIALQSRDSQLVAMSDKKERELVRENYLKKKLGLTHSDAELDEAVVAVGQVMKEDRTKNRVTVYYLLAEHFGLLTLFGGAAGGVAAAGAAAMAGAVGGNDDGTSAAPLAAAGLAGVAAAGVAAAAHVAPTPPAEPVRMAEPMAAQSSYDDTAAGGGMGWLKWLLLAAVLLALIFFGMRYCSNQAAQPVVEPDAAATAGETANTTAAPAAATTGTEATPAAVAPVAAVPQGSGVTAGERGGRPMLTVYFDTGKSIVSNDLAKVATNLKDYVAKNPDAKIAVSGYNDPTGNAAANAELSKNRAKAVAKALEAAGIPAASIGLEKPAATTGTGSSNAESRRVEAVVKP